MRNTIKHINNAKNDQGGFTLIEMAIVLMIMGLILASTAQLLTQRQEWLQAENTRVRIADATEAITAFRNLYGRYPCPASLTAQAYQPDNATALAQNYGRESDCTDITQAPGAGIGAQGYAVVNTINNAGAIQPTRLVTYDDTSTPAPNDFTNVSPRIRIGALPFKHLNMEERDTYDGYNNRIFYAITEHLAVSDTFNPATGAIHIVDENNNSLINPPADNSAPLGDTAHFIIFSAGENSAGGFNANGAQLACAATGFEAENCNFNVDATFRFAQQSDTFNGNATSYDDVVSYASHEDIPLWEKNPDGLSPGQPGYDDVGVKTSGGVGIGPTVSEHPSEDFEVEGTIIARDDPYTPEEEGKVQSDTICNEVIQNGTKTSHCFPSSLIAGELAQGGGMQCPSGQFMVGIKYGAPVCADEVKIECPNGSIAVGVKANGELECGAPPPGSCETEQRLLCGKTATLFGVGHNKKSTFSITTDSGGTRYERWQCKDGTWRHDRTWGDPCNCTPSVNPPNTVSCKSWSGCGDRYSGTKTVQTSRVCPSGNTNTVTLDDSGCVCENTSRTRERSCPSGFNKGKIQQKNEHICGPNPSCTGWQDTGNTCECQPETQKRQINCPNGLTGKIKQEKSFTCPGGSSSPGSWGGWQNEGGQPDSAFCTCKPSSYVDKNRSCPTNGHVGEYWVEVNFNCPSATTSETVVKNTCAPPPPVIHYWKKASGAKYQKSDSPVGNKVNSTCTAAGETGICYEGSYSFGACICK